MSDGNQISTKINMPGNHKDPTRVGPNIQFTFEIISRWIRLPGMDEYTTNGLIELASKYPTAALPSFRKNFNLMIARVRQKRRQEQHAQPPVIQQIESEENGKEISQRDIKGSGENTKPNDNVGEIGQEDQV